MKNIQFIKNTNNLTEIMRKKGVRYANKAVITVIKLLCEIQLFSYESRIRFTKKYLSIKSKVPIFINNDNLFIPTQSPKNYENIWINYFEIFGYRSFNCKTVIIFKDLKELIIPITYRSFKNSIKKAEDIATYFNLEHQILSNN